MKDIVELVQERLTEEGADGTEEELITLAQSYIEQAALDQDDGALDDDQLDTVAGGVGLVRPNSPGSAPELAQEAVRDLGNFKTRLARAGRVKTGKF